MNVDEKKMYSKENMFSILNDIEKFMRAIFTEDKLIYPHKVISVEDFLKTYIYVSQIPSEVSGTLIKGFISLYVSYAPESDLIEMMRPLIVWGLDKEAEDIVKHTYHKGYAKYVERVRNYTGKVYFDPKLGIHIIPNEEDLNAPLLNVDYVDVIDSDCGHRVMDSVEVERLLESNDCVITNMKSAGYRYDIFSVEINSTNPYENRHIDFKLTIWERIELTPEQAKKVDAAISSGKSEVEIRNMVNDFEPEDTWFFKEEMLTKEDNKGNATIIFE